MTERIGLTQQFENVEGRTETRSCLDQKWFSFLDSIDCIAIALPPTAEMTIVYLEKLELDAVILTGGNDIGQFSERDRLEQTILDFSVLKNRPVLGVCRGAQLINTYFGGSLRSVPYHIATRHKLLIDKKAKDIWQDPFEVNSYHRFSFLKSDLAPALTPLAFSSDGTVEAFKHELHRIFAVMWHPEREDPFQEYDKQFLRRLLNNAI